MTQLAWWDPLVTGVAAATFALAVAGLARWRFRHGRGAGRDTHDHALD